MNERMQVRDRRLWIDGRPTSLISAEVHYWRLDPSVWPAVLKAAVDLGLETVASYVQWHFHEYEEHQYDFTGKTDPKRNLVAYIELVRDMGLNLLIRPGPYTFAEWDNYGIPDYVAGYHRLHPRFQEAASDYIRAVCQVIRPYFVTNGEPIIMVQADNMYDLGQHRYDEQLGLLGGRGVFQSYLFEKYDGIGALNQEWDASMNSFEEAMATTANILGDKRVQARWMDFLEFKHWFTRQAAEWTVDEYRKNGVDLPMYSNVTKDQDAGQMIEVLDVVGINHYPARNYSLVPDEHRQLLNHVRLISTISPIPYVAELEAGIWHGYHYTKGLLHPDHYQFMLLSVLAGGAVTWTWYMLHDRDNWYMSPINSRGMRRKELFELFEKFVRIQKETQPAEWKRCSATGVTYYQRHASAKRPQLGYRETCRTSKAIYDAGIDFSFFSLTHPRGMPRILFYDGLDWLGRHA